VLLLVFTVKRFNTHFSQKQDIFTRIEEEKRKERDEQEEENHSTALNLFLNVMERPVERVLADFDYNILFYRSIGGVVQTDHCLHMLRIRFNLAAHANIPNSIIMQADDNLALNVHSEVAVSIMATRRNQTPGDPLPDICLCRSMPFNGSLAPNASDSADGSWFKEINTASGPLHFTYRSASTRPEDAVIQSIHWSCNLACLVPVIYGLDRTARNSMSGFVSGSVSTVYVDVHAI
jgi:hypothetical protein